ncbi:unnamed protein product [Ixodes pacificus]
MTLWGCVSTGTTNTRRKSLAVAVATPTEARAGRAVAPRFLPSLSLHLTCSLLVALVATDGNGLGRGEWGKGRRAFSGTVQGGQQHAAGCKRYRSAPGGGVFCFRPRPNPCPNSDIPSRRPPLQECGNGGGRKERHTVSHHNGRGETG